MALEYIKKEIDNAIKKLNELDTKITLYSTLHEKNEDAYNRGLNDAWNLAKKIKLGGNKDSLSALNLKTIFGTVSINSIFNTYTPQEALAKIEAYEKEQKEIKVGDVVYVPAVNTEDEKEDYGVVTNIYYDKTTRYEILMHNGDCMSYYDYEIEKTNKHIDIQSVLAQIGVDKDEKKVQD